MQRNVNTMLKIPARLSDLPEIQCKGTCSYINMEVIGMYIRIRMIRLKLEGHCVLPFSLYLHSQKVP